MKIAAALLASFLAPFALSAQTIPIHQSGETVTLNSLYASPSSNVSGCPVSLRAQQVSSVDMVQVERGRPQGAGQRLHLILSNPGSKQIAAARVTVGGFTFKPRAMNADAAPERESRSVYATQTIGVTFSPGPDKTVSATILVPGVTAAQTIDLIELTYADGSMWELAAGKSCRIAPDPLMLVGAR
jgi:hypothetical protein